MTGREYAAQHGDTDWTTAEVETWQNLTDADHASHPATTVPADQPQTAA